MGKSINFTFHPTVDPDVDTAAYFKEYRQQLEAHKASLVTTKAEAVEEAHVEPGIEVPLYEVVKRTKTGQFNTQSTLGKVVALLDSLGYEIKAGRSSAMTWIQAAHHGKRVLAYAATICFNGEYIKFDELKERA